MNWQNIGSAPCYRPYRLAYRLRGEPGLSKVLVSEITVNHWLPGSMELFTDAFLKQPGEYARGRSSHHRRRGRAAGRSSARRF